MVAQQAGLLKLPECEFLLQDETQATPYLQATNCGYNKTSTNSTTLSPSPANPSPLQASHPTNTNVSTQPAPSNYSSKHNTSNLT